MLKKRFLRSETSSNSVKVETPQELSQRYVKYIARTLALICAGLGSVTTVFYLFSPWPSGLAIISSLVTTGVFAGLTWQLAVRNRAKVAAWLFHFAVVAGFSFLFWQSAFILYYLLILLICVFGLILLGTQVALTTYGFLLVQSYFYAVILDKGVVAPTTRQIITVDFTTVTIWWIIIGATLWFVNIVYTNLIKGTRLLNAQAAELSQALEALNHRQSISEAESRQVFEMGLNLSAISKQQVTGSQQQVSAVAQAVSFVEEMLHAALSIINQTTQMKQSGEHIFAIAERIAVIFNEMVADGEKGEAAVDSTVQANENVSQQYKTIQRTLTDLLQLQNQIRKVVDSIRNISEETHLLALNASIEAAGAGEYGDRFMIVATEVRSLADRARQASQEVKDILGQVESGIGQAVEAVENGQQEVQLAFASARDSGQTIKELVQAIHENVEQIEAIGEAAKIVVTQATQVNTAATQQHAASLQTSTTLHDVKDVASQNFSLSNDLSHSAVRLEVVSQNLLTTFAQAA